MILAPLLIVNAALFFYCRRRNRRIAKFQEAESLKKWINANRPEWTERDDR